MILIFDQLSREEADTFSLVLNSSGIGNRIVAANDEFSIHVPDRHVDAARDAIRRYQSENPIVGRPLVERPPPSLPLSGVVVALLLLAAHLAVVTSAAPQDYVAVFGADARHITDGEFYRCITALLLHADAAHIAGNMVGMILFGGSVCTLTGAGVGWLMILACGFLGNLINALAYHTAHLSVGASTSVFGAVGLLCAIQAAKAAIGGDGWKRPLLAVGGGVALLGFLGTSARSDLGAHLFGFFIGFLMGGAYWLRVGPPPGRPVQLICGTVGAGLILWAWIRGVGV